MAGCHRDDKNMMKVIENNDSEYYWRSVQTTLSIFGDWKQIKDDEHPDHRVYLFKKTSDIDMKKIHEQLGKTAQMIRVPESVWDEYED